MRLLIIEDTAMFFNKLRELAEMHGHQVTCIIGAISCTDDSILAYDPDMKEITVAAGDFDAALVDGILVTLIKGYELVPLLCHHGVACVGMSDTKSTNEKMVAAGANGYVSKHTLMCTDFAELRDPAKFLALFSAPAVGTQAQPAPENAGGSAG